jgi:hypothetical protein
VGKNASQPSNPVKSQVHEYFGGRDPTGIVLEKSAVVGRAGHLPRRPIFSGSTHTLFKAAIRLTYRPTNEGEPMDDSVRSLRGIDCSRLGSTTSI